MKLSFDFEFKMKILFIILVSFFIFIISLIIYMTVDLSLLHNKFIKSSNNVIKQHEKNLESYKELKQKIESIDNMFNDIDFEKLKSLDTILKNVDITNPKEVSQLQLISKLTPLDYRTASILIGYSKKLDLPPLSIILGLIDLESNFNKYKVGKFQDRGYGQIIPDTEKWLINKYGYLLDLKYNPDKIFDEEYNLGLMCLYLYHLKKSYGENYHRILSEYNRGYFKLQDYYDKYETYATAYSNTVLEKAKKYKDIDLTDYEFNDSFYLAISN